MKNYEYFWQRVFDYVPTRKKIRSLEDNIAAMENDIQDLRIRLDAQERSIDILRTQLKEHQCQDRKNRT